MKSAHDETCQGSRIELRHDSSNCVSCLRTKFFYEEFQPAIEKIREFSLNVRVCGIITFLKACFQFDSVSNDEKSPLPDELSELDIFANSILPDEKKSIHYYNLLNKLAFSERDSNEESFSLSVYALNHKYQKSPGAKTKQSDKNNELEDIGKPSSSKKKKSQIAKTKLKKEVSNKIPSKGSLKRKRWYLNKLSKEEKDHEDDIFEERPFYRLTDLDEISSGDSDDSNVGTPTWSYSLSPRRASPAPEYDDDCYDINELRLSRKEAEEYQHRRKKRRKSSKNNTDCETPSASKSEAQKASTCQPSCSFTINNPFKDQEDHDSEEISDCYYSEEEEEKSNKKIS